MSSEKAGHAKVGLIAIGIIIVAGGVYQFATEPKPRLADEASNAFVEDRCPPIMMLSSDLGPYHKCVEKAVLSDPFSSSAGEKTLERVERAITRQCGPKADSDAWHRCVHETAITIADNFKRTTLDYARAAFAHDKKAMEAIDAQTYLEEPQPQVIGEQAAPSQSVQTSAPTWSTYINDKYAYTVEYPAAQLAVGPEPDAGDGVTMKAKSGAGQVQVYGEYNIANYSLDDLANSAEKECPSSKAAYRLVNSYMTATSCDKENQVLYQVTVMKNDRLVTIRAEYPTTDRERWNNIISRMNTSLHLADDKPSPSANQ